MDHKHRTRRTPGWLVHTVATVEDAAVLEHARRWWRAWPGR